MDNELYLLAEKVGHGLQVNDLLLATAESCTGGWLSEAITMIPGSSAWFERGFVTYSNLAKQEMLGVSPELINQHGAVSEATARAMAEGALKHSQADLALAITGIAGPDGGSIDKPVGTIWFAYSGEPMGDDAFCQHFAGDRQAIRKQAVIHMLEKLLLII